MDEAELPQRLNSGVYDPASPSAHESPLLSPEQLDDALEQGAALAADARVVVAGKELGIFEYLVNLLRVDDCLKAAKKRPLPAWLGDCADKSGMYPLHWAVILPGFDEDSRVELVQALLDAGADANCRDKDTFGLRVAGAKNKDLATKCGGKTPLHHLCGSFRETPQSLRAAELLLSKGASKEQKDHDSNSPAELAQMKGNERLAALLGAAPLGEEEAKQRLAAYERRCTEREAAWEQQQQEAKVQKRKAYAARLDAEYRSLHPKLYTLCDHEDFFEPSFLEAVRSGTKEAFQSIRDFKELSPGLYQYRIFRPEVCQQLMAEVDNFNQFAATSSIEVKRPNSMNRYGLILNDIGFLSTMDALMRRYIQPLAEAFFGERLGEGFRFESLHTFIVRYRMGEDLDLKTHADDSDLTLNVCLGKTFEGARLYFHRDSGSACSCASANDSAEEFAYPHPENCRFCTFHYDHTPGVGLMHTGRHVHGVEQLKSGERSNLIFWCRRPPAPGVQFAPG